MEIGAVVAVVSAALKHGHGLVELCQDLKHARAQIEERIVEVQSHWRRSAMQLEFTRRVHASLGEEHQQHQVAIITILDGKLKAASHKIQRLVKKRRRADLELDQKLRVKRWKYVFVKPFLDSLIYDLAKWQRMFDPSWYLIMRIADPSIDQCLKIEDDATRPEVRRLLKTAKQIRSAILPATAEESGIFLPSDGMNGISPINIPYSAAVWLQRHSSGTSSTFVVDTIPCPQDQYVGLTTQDIRRLASKLRCVDPSAFGVLKCHGVVKMLANNSRLTSFAMVFLTPSPAIPCTLRQLLQAPAAHSLSDRISLAKRLATSINYVHTLDFVHKNVRPENFLNFLDSPQSDLGSCYLIGFEQIRSADGKTYLRGDDAWEKNIYRHPERQGPFPQEAYNMQHDIYSLGVCLLEVGVWSSFVLHGEDGPVQGTGQALGLGLDELKRKLVRRPASIKDHLVALAKRELPRLIGNIYTSVVVTCLTCLDDDNEDFGECEDHEDADGVFVGVKYIEQVLLKLDDITL
ncbi:hypothetical protein LTR86_001684 [Recurvomyces mirabilis]|nr:hypothetical protein LTR86_001684 [Recurvomyces mirabilis]